jgi:hypothetical protein
MSPTQQRERVFRMAASSNDLAFTMALEISDAWFSCQALSAVLRHGPESRIEPLSSRIRQRAAECADDYGRAAVLAWLIGALVKRDCVAGARDVLASALTFAGRATPAGSQAEALCLLYQAAFPLGPECTTPVVRKLMSLHTQCPHWRCARAFVHCLAIHSTIAPEITACMIDSLRQPTLAARVQRAVTLGLTKPRSFF